MKPLIPLLAGTMLSTQAWALDRCRPSPDDPQARTCIYSPLQRYAVNGLVGFPVNLGFGPTELIKRSEFAYTGVDKDGNPVQTWKGPGKKDAKGGGDDAPASDKSNPRWKTNLPIWPLAAGHSSVVVVTQMPDGSERPYLFDLVASAPKTDCIKADDPGCEGDVTTTASLSFTYPADAAAAVIQAAAVKKQAVIAVAAKRQAKATEEVAVARLRTDVFYGQRNKAYQAVAEPRYKFLAPSEVTDNGWLTEMQWPENVQIPTVTIIDPVSKEERVAPITQQGRMLIISTTSEWFRLRLGPKAVMDLHNLHWSPERPDPQTGTTSPDVVRQVIYQDAKRGG